MDSANTLPEKCPYITAFGLARTSKLDYFAHRTYVCTRAYHFDWSVPKDAPLLSLSDDAKIMLYR